MKHTKGPWTIEGARIVHKPSGWLIVEMPHFVISDEDKANARLIAAAPELLEAAKRALKALEIYQPNCFENHELKAALAKAEGKE